MKGRLAYRCFDVLSKRGVVPALDRSMERQSWAPERLAAFGAERLCELLEFARTRVEHYRNTVNGSGPPQLATFPLMSKEVLRSSVDDLVSGGDRASMRRTSSGGSTGRPVPLLLDRETLDAQSAAMLRHRSWMGLDLICPQILLWGPPPDQVSYGTAAGRLRGFILRRRFFHTYEMDDARVRELRRLVGNASADLVEGYSGALDRIAAGAEPARRSPRAVLAGAEMLLPAQRRRIGAFFGATVYERYGSNEFASIAHTCSRGSLHVNSDRVVVEILKSDGEPAAPGELGEAVVTDLDNRGMPLIRFRIGDLLEAGGSCDCALPFPVIAAVHGRTADLLPGADGSFVSPLHLARALDGCGEVLQHQVAVTEREPEEIRLLTLGEADLDLAGRAAADLFGRPVPVRRVERLERWPSGKARLVIPAGAS